jgi:AmiR/NasT family two-component response regulator
LPSAISDVMSGISATVIEPLRRYDFDPNLTLALAACLSRLSGAIQ